VIDAGKAIAGLSSALADALPEKQPSLQQKLDAFRLQEATLRQEQTEQLRSSEARQELNRVAAQLERLRASIGLDREEARLAELQRERGRRSGRSGASFEEIALELTRRCILPDLLRAGPDPRGAERVRVLRGVTLGAARTEIDQLVVRRPPDPTDPVEALALVEVKRNLNDLAHGFVRRQENLAWLTGNRGRYDTAEYRTRQFPTGHFDREAVHRQGGESFVFAPESFRRFRSDAGTGMILDGLYLLTRRGSIWGVSGATLARIGHRIATDERWEPNDAAYLRRLLDWCRSLAGAIETPEVLRLYMSTEARARQILVVRGRKSGSREAGAGE
jgi:hypothetical protein